MTKILVNGNLTLSDIVNVARNGCKAEIPAEVYQRMAVSRNLVDDCVREARVVYGITTGFGKFSDVSIAEEDSKKLQKNLIMSHACGVGEPLLPETVRAMMLLRINSLSVGNSGISRNTIDALLALLNSDVIPYVPSKGSLGASGDLVPLAHMTLTLLGMGDAFYKGKKMTAKKALALAGLSPIELTAKEGLALINGTQAMNSFATLNVVDAERLNKIADICSALTMEAQRAVTDPFDPRIQELRRQQGQIDTAKNLLTLLNESERITRQGEIRVQDAYTIRCVPQIHGPSKDALSYVKGVVEREINAVTDNPVIFPETDQAISGGNFHGQCLAMALDFLAISLSELANVSERRIERLVNPQLSGLPAFLVKKGGLNSGFMIPQYVAASLVNENKVLSHPACVDSITSSANQEDHVSMGMTAARKAKTIVDNVTNVLAIELLVACQAIDFGDKTKKLGKGTAAAYETVRNAVTFMNKDRFIAPDIAKCAELIRNGNILNAVENAVGKLL
ncbi:MAG TPA: histidine ammonia-lyase [Clostridia bacterium]|nr:histidine ammonia-lyase [Clostridia bacterium]